MAAAPQLPLDRLLDVVEWGRIPYREAMRRQRERWEAVRTERAAPALFLLEHDPVITLGRRASEDHLRLGRTQLAAQGIEVIETDRGGEATYHGPGQLTLYAVLPVQRMKLGAADLVRLLAAAIRSTLEDLDIHAPYDPERPGLWVGDGEGRKICAVGMRIQRGVSLHGAAVNVSTRLEAFSLFVPCGMPEATATSILAETGSAPEPAALGRSIAGRLAASVGLTVRAAMGSDTPAR
ncbi:MAG: lipoyl(octanoyl) transferase [Deltaproteobacteria bacterium]|nr:MAG: lipoyl(octanoyl) transferase [Deltaproteobacteria bacterium]